MEHAASVAKTFITSDAVVVDIKVPEQAPAANPMGGGGSGKYGTKKVGYLLSNWNELTTCVGFVFRFWILEKFLEMSFHSCLRHGMLLLRRNFILVLLKC